MKKILMSFVAIASSVSLMALTPTATATITVTGTTSGSFDKVILVESTVDGFSAAFDNGYDAAQPDVNIPGIYAISGTERFASNFTNDLTDQALGFISGTDTEYKITFSGVTGNTIKLYDKVTGTETVVDAANDYTFTAAANARIDDRFVVNCSACAPAEPTICHRNDQLEVYNSNGMTVQVLNLDGSATSIADVAISTDSQTIPLADLAAGQYLVKWNGKDLIIQK